MKSALTFSSTLALTATVLAGCGGGGDASATGSLPPASVPATGTSTFTMSSSAQVVPLPASAGFTGSMYVPNATAGVDASVKVTAGISPPLGTPIMQGSAVGNQPAPIPLLYMTLTPSNAVQLAGAPSLSLTLPSNLSTLGYDFYVAYFDPTKALNGYQTDFEGPASVNGQTVSFAQPSRTMSFMSSAPYSFALYEIPLASPAPSSSP